MNTHAIVIKLDIEYIKETRATLISEGSANPFKTITEPVVRPTITTIRDTFDDTCHM